MKFINHNIRAGSARHGSISVTRLYGINGGEHLRESEPSRADSFSGDAPGAVNLIRKSAGTVTKRRGFTKKSLPFEPDGQINAVYVYNDYTVYLAGSKLYCLQGQTLRTHTLAFDTAGMRPFCSGGYIFFAANGALIIYRPDGDSIAYWSDSGCGGGLEMYTPTIYIGNLPNGAGASYEGVNLLCPRVCETYQGDGESTVFTTHLEPVGEIEAYIKNESGEYSPTAFASFDKNGITLESAPPAPDIEGEDNVKLVYRRKNGDDGAKKLYRCTCFTVFGVGGNRDRVFLSGDSAQAGRVYYSHMDNPLFFCDIDYIKVGDADTDVCSLASYGAHLAVITDSGIYTVSGHSAQEGAIKQDALFVTDGLVATPRPIEKEPALIFGGEPVYLTHHGVYAISASGVLDERCAALRSSRINVFLQNEQLNTCKMATFGDYLVISDCRDRLYLIDSKQFSASDSEPYASKQYECFVWTGITARVLWTQDNVLYFSDGQGVFAFDGGYADERESGVFYPIDAYWETPYLYGSDVGVYKFFDRISLLCDSEGGADTNVKIFARFDNSPWRTVREYDAKMRVFSYVGFDYSQLTYSDYVYNYAVTTRLLHKKGRGIKLRFQNDRIDEPFTMVRFAIDYMTM